MNEKLYTTFAPPERLTLMLQAMTRRDDAEVERLRDSCPRKTYTQPDRAFDDRVDLAFDVLAVVCIDLRALWAKLFAIAWAKEVVRHFAPAHHLTAALGFIDGARCTQELGQSPFFATAAGQGVPIDDDEEEDDEEPELVRAAAFADRMMAVQGRAERATADVLGVFEGAANDVSQDLADQWAAFDGFCRTRIGLGALAFCRAWQMPLGEDVLAMLKLYPAKPDAEKVTEHQAMLNLTWDRRFGDGGGDE